MLLWFDMFHRDLMLEEKIDIYEMFVFRCIMYIQINYRSRSVIGRISKVFLSIFIDLQYPPDNIKSKSAIEERGPLFSHLLCYPFHVFLPLLPFFLQHYRYILNIHSVLLFNISIHPSIHLSSHFSSPVLYSDSDFTIRQIQGMKALGSILLQNVKPTFSSVFAAPCTSKSRGIFSYVLIAFTTRTFESAVLSTQNNLS